MTNKEEKKLEKINNKNTKINNNEKDESNNLIKKNLTELLEVQLKESKEKIIEKEKITEQEIASVYNRLNKEIENSIKFSLEKLIIDFLPIVDNIERAMNLIETTDSKESYIEIFNKLECIYDLLKKSFILFNIKKIDKINILFNPSIHQAMSVQYTDQLESNQIVTVMQPGYILHETRLLRPAMVIVSKKRK
ncbi:nucleotide exchange factor GrpE [Buchnera aphidicola (Acyrthosiphon lactucae)]|uniref:Protein GrpE n=1 Tax=Buchnera aphidicola (Acyrthosiphon lactucae) TaxID=1241832 RepID=A0A4D6XPZ9_9GAMM|nr:nucleotide exchange factor GrpE [Buchnera aphidicola]QCI17649.1 nucleotide exchange factor GrpE [Buchnera aphidicola (Acyrthosiphon lactucae)]